MSNDGQMNEPCQGDQNQNNQITDDQRYLLQTAIADIVNTFNLQRQNQFNDQINNINNMQNVFLVNSLVFDLDLHREYDDIFIENDDSDYSRAQTESIEEYQPKFHPASDNIMSKFVVAQGFEGTPCALCLDSDEQTEGNLRPPCGHIFHKSCLQNWLLRGNFCPVCRTLFGET